MDVRGRSASGLAGLPRDGECSSGLVNCDHDFHWFAKDVEFGFHRFCWGSAYGMTDILHFNFLMGRSFRGSCFALCAIVPAMGQDHKKASVTSTQISFWAVNVDCFGELFVWGAIWLCYELGRELG